MNEHVSVQDVRDAFTLIPGTRNHSERQGRIFDMWLRGIQSRAWHQGAWAQKQASLGASEAVDPYHDGDAA